MAKFPTLTISQETVSKRNRRYGAATRAFQSTLLCMVAWPKGYKDPIRPLFVDYCGSEAEHRAFTANLRCGRPASMGDRSSDKVELLKSEAYVYAKPQTSEAGVRQIVYLPIAFDLEVKVPDDEIWVCVLPPARLLTTVTSVELAAVQTVYEWRVKACADAALAVQREQARIDIEEAGRDSWRRTRVPTAPAAPELDADALRYWALIARELCVRLDGRTRYPVPTEPVFRAMLLNHLISERVLKLSEGCPLRPLANSGWGRDVPSMSVWGDLAAAGYLPPVGLQIEQDAIGVILTAIAQEFYRA